MSIVGIHIEDLHSAPASIALFHLHSPIDLLAICDTGSSDSIHPAQTQALLLKPFESAFEAGKQLAGFRS